MAIIKKTAWPKLFQQQHYHSSSCYWLSDWSVMFRFPVDTTRGRCCVCLRTSKETPSSKVTLRVTDQLLLCVSCPVLALVYLQRVDVSDLRWVQVNSSEEAYRVMKIGKKNQSFSSTRLNQLSSRRSAVHKPSCRNCSLNKVSFRSLPSEQTLILRTTTDSGYNLSLLWMCPCWHKTCLCLLCLFLTLSKASS